MNIKTPPMPNFPENSVGDNFLMACQDRDQQWIEMVRPVVEAAERGLEYAEAELQQRKELYEPYGMERKWATEQRDVDAIRAALSQIKGE